MSKILCKTCANHMRIKIEGYDAPHSDIERVICLVYPKLFDELDIRIGNLEKMPNSKTETTAYPKVTECNKYRTEEE